MAYFASSGQFDQRISLQQKRTVRDSYGQETVTWSEFATVWAKAEPLAGREYFSAQQMQSAATVRFRVRYRAGIDDTMRVVWRDKPYEITSEPIDLEGKRRELHLMCTQGIRDGR
jgi:SPP1 family predicted phage head-tail adaptor